MAGISNWHLGFAVGRLAGAESSLGLGILVLYHRIRGVSSNGRCFQLAFELCCWRIEYRCLSSCVLASDLANRFASLE